jgi:hypothetical protein
MITGCAPIFMLGLLGVSLGSWFFGTHIAARLTGLILLDGFLLYFALLNWTAQSNQRKRGAEVPDAAQGGSPARENGQVPFTDEDRAEWVHYLKTEGRILWVGVVFLTLVGAAMLWKS